MFFYLTSFVQNCYFLMDLFKSLSVLIIRLLLRFFTIYKVLVSELFLRVSFLYAVANFNLWLITVCWTTGWKGMKRLNSLLASREGDGLYSVSHLVVSRKACLILCCFFSIILAGCSQESTDSAISENATTLNHASVSEKSDAQLLVRVGMSGNHFPFSFTKAGQLQGFEIDMWREMGKRLHADVEFVTAPFSGLFGLLEVGKIDTIANQIALTDKRKQAYLFTQPYVATGAQLAVNKNQTDIKSIKDLTEDNSVGTSLGSNFEQIIKKNTANSKVKIVTYEGNGLEYDLSIGRIDAIVLDRSSILALIKKSGLSIKTAGKPFALNVSAMPFIKSDHGRELLKKVDQVIDGMQEDGSLSALSERWFGEDITV